MSGHAQRVVVSILLIGMALASAPVSAQSRPWQPVQFPISYWYSPPHALLDDARVADIASLGFTVMGNLSAPTVRRTREILDLAARHGLKALVCDPRLTLFLSDQDGWEGTIGKVITDYADHLALYGYFLKDEPNRAQFPLLAKMEDALSAGDPAHLPFINLLPTYADTNQLGTPSYWDHLEEFLTTVTPRVISYDHYALLKNRLRPDYFENLELVRDASRRHGVPFWYIIQLIPGPGRRDLTEPELRWQIYTSLAYGVKGIWYFTMWTVPSWHADNPSVVGIYDLDGKRTRFHEPVKRANAELRVIGRAMLGLDSVGVFHTPNVPAGARRLGGRCPVVAVAGGDLLIGWLKDAGSREYILVVNKDYRRQCRAAVTVAGQYQVAAEISRVTGLEEAVSAKDSGSVVLDVVLRPGGGRLYRLAERRPRRPQPIVPGTKLVPRDAAGHGFSTVMEYHIGRVPPGGRCLGGTAPLASATGDDLIVGWLKDGRRRDYLRLVNADPQAAATSRLALRGPVRGVYEVGGPDDPGRAVPLESGAPRMFRVDLGPSAQRIYRVDRNVPWASLPPVLTRFPVTFRGKDEIRAWHGTHSVSDIRVAGARLTLQVTGPDPYLVRRRLRIPATTCPVLVIRMRKEAGTKGQIFWTTSESPAFAADRHITYATIADGQFHDIRLPVGTHPQWAGKTITALRIDPDVTGEPGKVSIESIRAETAGGAPE